MPTLSIRVDDELERDLARIAAQSHRTKSEVARDLLRRHLLVEEFRRLRERLRPYGEAAGYLTDEDVFRDIS